MSSAASKPATGRKASAAAPKATTATPAVATPAVATPAKVAASTKAAAKTAVTAPAVAAPVKTVAPAPAVAPTNTVETHEEVNIVAQFTAAVEKVNTLRTELATVFSTMKKLEKQIPRELKRAQKGRRNRKVEGAEGAPKKETIFTKPTPISDALCTFLGIAKGSLISRSEVTSRICAYAKEKGLMEKQKINADATLRKLLALKDDDELKILNLQRFLKSHYLPVAKPTA